MGSKQHSRVLDGAVIDPNGVTRIIDEDDREATPFELGLIQQHLGLEEQLQAEQQKNEKLSALVIEQEGQYRDERRERQRNYVEAANGWAESKTRAERLEEQLEAAQDELRRIAIDPARALSLIERGVVSTPASSPSVTNDRAGDS